MERTESGSCPFYDALQAATAINGHLENDWALIRASREEIRAWGPALANQMAASARSTRARWLHEPELLESLLGRIFARVLRGERPKQCWWIVYAAGLLLLESGATAADVVGFGGRLRSELAALAFETYPAPRAAELYGAVDRIWSTGETVFCWMQAHCQKTGHRDLIRGLSAEELDRASGRSVTEFADDDPPADVSAPFNSALKSLLDWTGFGDAERTALHEGSATTEPWSADLARELLDHLLRAPLSTGSMETAGLSRADAESRIVQLFQRLARGREELALFRGMWTIGLLAARSAAEPSLLVAALSPLTQSILRRCMEEPEGERAAAMFVAYQKSLTICGGLVVEGFFSGRLRTRQLAGLPVDSLSQAQAAATRELRAAPFQENIVSMGFMRESGFLALLGRPEVET